MGTHTEELFTVANTEVFDNALANHTPIFYKKQAGTKKILYAHCIHCNDTVFHKDNDPIEGDRCRDWYKKHVVSNCSKVWFKYEDDFKKYQQKAVLIEKEQQHSEHEELLKTIKLQEEEIQCLKEEIQCHKEDLEDYKDLNKNYEKIKLKSEKFGEVYYDEQDKHKKTLYAIEDLYQAYMKGRNLDEMIEKLNDMAQSVYFKDLDEEDE